MVASGLAVGLNKGHVVTKRELPKRASRRKGVSMAAVLYAGTLERSSGSSEKPLLQFV